MRCARRTRTGRTRLCCNLCCIRAWRGSLCGRGAAGICEVSTAQRQRQHASAPEQKARSDAACTRTARHAESACIHSRSAESAACAIPAQARKSGCTCITTAESCMRPARACAALRPSRACRRRCAAPLRLQAVACCGSAMHPAPSAGLRTQVKRVHGLVPSQRDHAEAST